MGAGGVEGARRGVAAQGEVQAAEARAKALEFNATVAKREGSLAKRRGQFAEARLREDLTRFKGAQRAAIGASGTTFTGSPLLLLAESAEDAALEIQVVRFETKVARNAAKAKRNLARFQAGQERAAGFTAAVGRLLGG